MVLTMSLILGLFLVLYRQAAVVFLSALLMVEGSSLCMDVELTQQDLKKLTPAQRAKIKEWVLHERRETESLNMQESRKKVVHGPHQIQAGVSKKVLVHGRLPIQAGVSKKVRSL